MHAYAAPVLGHIVLAYLAHKLRHVALGKGIALSALLEPRKAQQMVYEQGHVVCLFVDNVKRSQEILARYVLALCAVAACSYDGYRSSQLVRSVGGKLLFRGKRALEPVKHAVKGV